jgi:hypothetical protein
MPCIPFRGGIVCTYSTEYALLPVQECGWCHGTAQDAHRGQGVRLHG